MGDLYFIFYALLALILLFVALMLLGVATFFKFVTISAFLKRASLYFVVVIFTFFISNTIHNVFYASCDIPTTFYHDTMFAANILIAFFIAKFIIWGVLKIREN
jgi:hypothetical protein